MYRVGFSILLFCFWFHTSAIAETYDFDTSLSAYQEGDIPVPLLGRNIVIKDLNGEKFVTGQYEGQIAAKSLTLSGSFEVLLNVATDFRNHWSIAVATDYTEFRLYFTSYNRFRFGETNDEIYWNNTNWRKGDKNEIRLLVNGGQAKTYINGQFFQSIILPDANLTYSTIYVDNIIKDATRVYSIQARHIDANTSGNESNQNTGNNLFEYERGFTDGQNACVDDPISCGVATSVLEYERGRADAKQLCVLDPAKCGIASPVAEYNRGIDDGRNACRNDPTQCGLDSPQVEYERGKDIGQEICRTNPADCGITIYPEGETNAYERGRQACIDNPESCGIVTQQTNLPTYTPNAGLIQIPVLAVYDVLGGASLYRVNLYQNTLSLDFRLDADSVQAIDHADELNIPTPAPLPIFNQPTVATQPTTGSNTELSPVGPITR
ncbi:hypothetical protein [Candidatus Albibeggiatoa sp. nov. NOAA]|uniref:hypothetical protein n=1 Tax=Candidatus Albibeggiatoa sp. nov. NOAA TaxID=3162724 RepID=UPI0032FF7944|nr:hypothetical protein [Thiotrichaceae bacterium]